MQKTREILKTLERHHEGFRQEIRDTELELNDIDVKRNELPPPGDEIFTMMEEWGKQPVLTNQQIDTRAAELWKTKEQFEKDLWAEVTRADSLLSKMKQECSKRVQQIRSQNAYRIEALEHALSQLKHKSNVQTERACMQLAEMESTMMNVQKSREQLAGEMDDIDAILKKGLDFNSE